jgi:adenylate cyclase class 2
MKEIEVKVLEINRAECEKTLSKLGAKKIFDDEILTIFFDFADGRIFKRQDVLRLRLEEQKFELTYKKVHFSATSKTADEYSVEVSDTNITQKILECMGLSVVESMQKHRISYILDDVRFDFDQYQGIYGVIPEFLEIEARNAESIYTYARLLGIKNEDCLPWSTKDLVYKYLKKDK